jgi:RND family efflux transporter MFP subunit
MGFTLDFRSGCALRLAVLLTPTVLVGCTKENSYVPPPPPKVAVERPVQQAVTRYLETTGNTTAVNSVDLVARVEGFLSAQDYVDGNPVKQGSTLFTIEPLPYLTKLQQAQAQQAATQAQLVQAEQENSRQAALLRQNVNSLANAQQALAKRDALLAQLQADQANVQSMAINYTYTRVMAPFDGVVSAHLVSVGELVGNGAATRLATIVQLQPIYATFNVNEQAVLRIRAMIRSHGLTPEELHRVPVEIGLQNETGYPHAGVLDYTAPTVDPSSGTLTARGIFENTDHALLPGYFVRVRVPVGREDRALLVPTVALGADQGGRYVLVVDKDNVVEQRRVTVGPQVGDLQVIETGVAAADRVVTEGMQQAVPGAKVDPRLELAAR